MQPSSDPVRLLTIKDLADRWAISPKTVTRMIKSNHLPFIRIGGQIRFHPSDVALHEKRKGIS